MEITLEKVIPLIKGHRYSFDFEDDDEPYEPIVVLGAKSVNLAEEMTADPSCLKTKAISEYFRSQKKYCSFLTCSFYEEASYFELTKDFVWEAWRLLQDPFIQIQILEYRKTNPKRILFERHFQLHYMMTSTYNRWESEPRDSDYRQELEFLFANETIREAGVLRVSLGWKEPVKIQLLEAQSVLGKMLEDESTMDLRIVAGNGAEVKCHLPVFAAQAPAFSAMVSAKTGMKEAESKRVELKENSEVGLGHLVRYLYGVELSVGEMGSDTALELFTLAHKYGLSQLETSLAQLFLCMKDMEWFTPDVVLELYLFVKNVEAFEKLKEHSLVLMKSIPADQLRSCELFKKLDKAESVHLSRKLGHSHNQKPTPTQRKKRAKLN